MNKRNQPPRDLCAQRHDDDGINPREDRKERARRSGRKDLQLCGQVMSALNSTLQGEVGSGILRELMVVAVEPAPDASRVRVHVAGGPLARLGAARVLVELGRARAFLRIQVGEAISRKRVPELIFVPAVNEEEGHE